MRCFKKSRSATALCLVALYGLTFHGLQAAAIGRSRRTFAKTTRARSVGKIIEKRERTSATKLEAWPVDARFERLADIGRGKAIVFSPDFSAAGNRKFYERLGFAYFEDSSWYNIVNGIRAHNNHHTDNRIETLIIESHGTNGNGLKLQAGTEVKSARSYISIGALQEKLEGTGVRLCVVAACNSGRLFRPQIYKTLDARTRDPLFLPATRGIINASLGFNPSQSTVAVIYPLESHLETTNEGDTSELSSVARALVESDNGAHPNTPLAHVASPFSFVVSDIFIQLLLHDPRLKMNASGYVTTKSRANFPDDESEKLFGQFLFFINDLAKRESLSIATDALRH